MTGTQRSAPRARLLHGVESVLHSSTSARLSDGRALCAASALRVRLRRRLRRYLRCGPRIIAALRNGAGVA